MPDGPFYGSITDEALLGSIGGKNGGSIATLGALAGIAGGVAGAIGLALAIDGAMKAFAPH
ncbi:hypothetical protein [Tomitella fengzijianii]|uniref:Uncharacterized protein n=1 Tax=Tomitella fengzijianii TaxID=2597660 RepID=A0A516X5F6_9ACTN|nr:hypothetical protein [Tomitella fengzijianii]QDQ98296.1 hypothetical protein FO059_14480 [Tomitella fengzijianii]